MAITADEAGIPPLASDLDGWRQAIADGSLGGFRPEAIVATIQAMGPRGDQRALNDLMNHISDEMLRFIRRKVSTQHKNRGRDIVELAHSNLIEAILKPDSPDGKGLCVAFWARVKFRVADAIRSEEMFAERHPCYETDLEGVQKEPIDPTLPEMIDENIEVARVLALISDPKKRLAFRLHMEGVPLESKRGPSIARALDVSAKTAGVWIEEVKSTLATKVRNRP
jgi:DNA-directed RNA polymerase specialized sigma24 family protein